MKKTWTRPRNVRTRTIFLCRNFGRVGFFMAQALDAFETPPPGFEALFVILG